MRHERWGTCPCLCYGSIEKDDVQLDLVETKNVELCSAMDADTITLYIVEDVQTCEQEALGDLWLASTRLALFMK